MKTIIIGLTMLIAAPALAQTVPAQPKKECCCCGKEGEKKMDCCDKMKGDKAGADAHAGHDMSGMDKK
jgi:hypothetical protein